jgi:hypothetical protein
MISISTAPFAAKAHYRDRNYSNFHAALQAQEKSYALQHLYSIDNLKYFLFDLGWNKEEIEEGAKYSTIDVYKNVVYVHIPNKIIRDYVKPVPHRTIKKMRGLSRFVSKLVFVEILIKKCDRKADVYKLESAKWDEFTAMGNNGSFYQLLLSENYIICSCHAFSGISKAFGEDSKAFEFLKTHPKMQGQIPDKHVLAIWKYLNCENLGQYKTAYKRRLESAIARGEIEEDWKIEF